MRSPPINFFGRTRLNPDSKLAPPVLPRKTDVVRTTPWAGFGNCHGARRRDRRLLWKLEQAGQRAGKGCQGLGGPDGKRFRAIQKSNRQQQSARSARRVRTDAVATIRMLPRISAAPRRMRDAL